MTILVTLAKDCWIAGAKQAAGSSISVDRSLAGSLISGGIAIKPADWDSSQRGNTVVFANPAGTALVGTDGAEYVLQRAANTVFFIGDSLTFRANRYSNTTSASVTGAVLTIGGTFLDPPPPGSLLRVPKATDSRLVGSWPILTSTTSEITAQLPADYTGADLGPGQNVTYAAQISQSAVPSYFAGRAMQNGRGVTLAGIWGRAGGKVQDLLDNIAIPLASTAGRIAVMIGTNDLSDGTPETVDATIARLNSLYTQLLAAGKLVDAFTIPPLGSGYSTAAAATPNILRVNGWIRAKCLHTPGLTCSDIYTRLKASGSDYAETGTMLADNIHLATLGARLAGEGYYTDIAASLQPVARQWVKSAADGYMDATSWNLLANPLFEGSGGTAGTSVTGTVPTSWSVDRNSGTVTCVSSTPAHASGMGNDIQVAHTTTGTSQYNTVSQDITALAPPGTRLEFGAEFESVDPTAGQYAKAMLEITVAGVQTHASVGDRNVTYANGERWPATGQRVVLLSEPVTIPAGATSVVFRLRNNAGAIGPMTAKWGRPFVRVA